MSFLHFYDWYTANLKSGTSSLVVVAHGEVGHRLVENFLELLVSLQLSLVVISVVANLRQVKCVHFNFQIVHVKNIKGLKSQDYLRNCPS